MVSIHFAVHWHVLYGNKIPYSCNTLIFYTLRFDMAFEILVDGYEFIRESKAKGFNLNLIPITFCKTCN